MTKRCKHHNVRLLEFVETSFEWEVENGSLVADWADTRRPTGIFEITCRDCNQWVKINKNSKNLPVWVRKALAALQEAYKQQ